MKGLCRFGVVSEFLFERGFSHPRSALEQCGAPIRSCLHAVYVSGCEDIGYAFYDMIILADVWYVQC